MRDAAFRVVQEGAASDLGEPPAGERVLAPIATLGEAAAALGHVNAPLDRSGAQRLEYPVMGYGADYFPSFSLEIARHHLGVDRDRSRLLLGQGIALDERFVPTDESMRLPINYDRPGRFPAVSAATVLGGEADQALFADKIALIGGTAAGIGNSFVTPFSSLMPGVERHATVVDSILRQDFLERREASVLVDLAVVILAGVLLGWVAERRGMLGASATFLLVAAGLGAANVLAFIHQGLWLNLFLPLAALTLIFLVVLAYSYFVGKRQERMIRAAFEHYLSPDLVDLVCRDPALLRLGGERRELTVLFADIRDSTRLAQKLAPDRFAALLNDALGAMTGVLLARGGMLDKFTGDGFLAIFGAPVPQPDHALRACLAALDMLRALEAVRPRWAGLEVPLEVGIGINSGPMIIGNMGSTGKVHLHRDRRRGPSRRPPGGRQQGLSHPHPDFRGDLCAGAGQDRRARARLGGISRPRAAGPGARAVGRAAARPRASRAPAKVRGGHGQLAGGRFFGGPRPLRGVARRKPRRLSGRDLSRALSRATCRGWRRVAGPAGQRRAVHRLSARAACGRFARASR